MKILEILLNMVISVLVHVYQNRKKICRIKINLSEIRKALPLPLPYLELSFCHCRYKPFKTTPISQNRDYNTSPTQVHNVTPLLHCHVVLRISFTSKEDGGGDSHSCVTIRIMHVTSLKMLGD